jgi:hypothetical protein
VQKKKMGAKVMKRRWIGSAVVLLAVAVMARAEDRLQVVGVLGNTSGMSNCPIPFAYYSGIACDARGRLYLAGAREEIVVCDQDGRGLVVLPLPDAKQWTPCSLLTRAGGAIFGVAAHVGQDRSMLYRIDTDAAEPARIIVTRVAEGPGAWAISPVLDRQGRVCVGRSEIPKRAYSVVAVEPTTGREESLFVLDQPSGATRPWLHFLQVDPDGSISIRHAGGVNWGGRYSPSGQRLGDAVEGQIVGQFRYHYGYGGTLRRMDLTGSRAAPGECGAEAPEIRMPRQMVQVGDRYFFAGRGGAVEAAWSGTNFVFTRHLGAVYIEDLTDVGDHLAGIAYTSGGNNDVQHTIEIPKNQPIGELLKAGGALHWCRIEACQPDGEALWFLGQRGKAISLWRHREHQALLEVKLPEVKSIGQAAIAGRDLLWADPHAGTIWRRPITDKQSPPVAWRTGLAGVIGLAVSGDAVFAATPTQVHRLSADGNDSAWTSPETYRGVRRLAATPAHVYGCDTAGCVVDQLDVRSGRRIARLGVEGEAGSTLDRLKEPYAVAADLNAVYIADNGNGRVVVATTTLWRPDIPTLPRDDRSAIAAVTLKVRPPQPGRMSLNIYDEHDVTVRQLACAAPSDQPVAWDGRDQYGQWAAPGKYRYHGLIAPKLSLRYVTSIGQSGDPPYRTADGRGSWGGVWGYVMDVCPVGPEPDGDIIVLWSFEEGEGGLIRMSQDGAVRWKQHLDWWMKAGQRALACDGESIYIVAASAIGAPKGQSNYSGTMNRPLLWRVDAATGAKRPFPATDQEHQCMFGHYLPGKRIVTAVAVRDGRVYLTAPEDNTLFVADAKSGRELAAWHIEQVAGVAIDANGKMFVGSGSRIVELDGQGNIARVIADAGGPIWALKLSPDGAFVASVGAPRNQVVYFSAEGKERRALGRPGGRPQCGAMEPTSFRDPVGLCVTGNGRLFVAESAAPKRFTRWSAEGAMERQFHGPYYYSGMFGIDEERPEHVYGDTHSDLIRYVVDYETGRWDVDHYWIDAYKDSGVPAKWWPRIRHWKDRTWWCSGSGGIVELQDDRVRGVAAVYGGCVTRQADGSYQPRYHEAKTGLMGTWSDPGAGRSPADGWHVTDHPAYPVTAGGPQQGWGAYFDEDFNLYMHDWSDGEAGGVWKIPVARWTAEGPVYLWEKAEHVGGPRGHGLLHGANGARTAFYHDGAAYAFNGGYNSVGLPGVGHGHDWEFAQVTKYDARTGDPLWHAGERADAFIAPGQHYCPTGPAGVVDSYLFWTDENSLIHVWDIEHGLYVDTLLEDCSRGPIPSPYSVWVELFNSRVFRHPKTGKVYLLAASDAIHVFEVLGIEQKPIRFQGELTLTEADIARARRQSLARSAPKQRTLLIPRCPAAVTIDGDPAEFARAPAAAMVLGEHARGTARLMYDERMLYVAFDVEDDSPWRNAGSDVPTLFKTGDSVDLWLGPSPGKRQLGTRDVRVLFAPQGEGTIAVAFRPKVEGQARRVPFRSPSGEVWMDRVEVLSDVTVAVKRRPGGYCLEAAIPRDQIGLAGNADRVGLDFSINFSDPAGQRNVARIHWGRNGAAMVYDLPSEARFEPETWGIGVFEK